MNLTTTNSQTTGFPLVIATQSQQPTARLKLRNSQGQVIQQWSVNSNKCTLGSAASCALRCELPGVAPYHALLVIGARQIFIRALAPKLTRDGQPFNELLLTNADSHFEIAGHRFELSRNSVETGENQVPHAMRDEALSPQRIKFTLARPFELRNRPQPAQLPHVNTAQQAIDLAADSRSSGDSKWVAQLVQAAMQPLECQLQNLAGPLSELQRESRKQRRLRRRRALRKRNATNPQPDATHPDSTLESPSHRDEQAQLTEQVQAMVLQHSAAMDALTERISEVNQQLLAIEQIVTEQRLASQAHGESQPAVENPQLTLQSAAIEQLQHNVGSVSATLEKLQAEHVTGREDDQQWKNGLQSQLSGLAQVIERLSASVVEVHQVALRAAADPQVESSSLATHAQQPTAEPHPVSDWQVDSDSLLASLPNTAEAWGLASDELTPDELASDELTPDELTPDELASDEPSASQQPSGSEPEFSEPEFSEASHAVTYQDDAEQSAARSTEPTEIEPGIDSDQAGASSLPSWWADSEPQGDDEFPGDSELQGADPESELQASLDAARQAEFHSSHFDESFSQQASDVAEPVYESVSQIDDRITESVYSPDSECSSDADNAAKPSAELTPEPISEEFYGLAQLAPEEHLREAESLPLAPQADSYDLNPTAHDLIAADQHEPPVAVESQAIDGDHRLTSDDPLYGVDQAGDAQLEVVADDPQPVVENAAGVDENDSVEEYMRKLLARMRGVPEEEVELKEQPQNRPSETGSHASTPTAHGGSTSQTSATGTLEQSSADRPTANYGTDTLPGAIDITEPFDPEKYMPRALAPERSNSLAAMRELANSSARTAIHKSSRQRHVSSIALKSVIAGVGLVVGMVLLAINGLNLNIGLVATVASFLVAAIWGYDSISSIRPMLQSELILNPQTDSKTAPVDEQD